MICLHLKIFLKRRMILMIEKKKQKKNESKAESKLSVFPNLWSCGFWLGICQFHVLVVWIEIDFSLFSCVYLCSLWQWILPGKSRHVMIRMIRIRKMCIDSFFRNSQIRTRLLLFQNIASSWLIAHSANWTSLFDTKELTTAQSTLLFSMVVGFNNLSLSSADELQEAVKYAFSDSEVAQEYKCKQVLNSIGIVLYMMISSSFKGSFFMCFLLIIVVHGLHVWNIIFTLWVLIKINWL